MKHRIFTVFAVLIFLSGGSQAVLGQEGAALDRGNTVPANMLPVELQDLDIKDYFISSDAKEVGVIQTMTGHLVMRHGDSGQAYFAVPGDKIFEKDVMLTLKESRCRVKFIDDNLMTLAEDTNINIKEFVVDLEMKEKKSVFAMAKGKAMFYALKLFKYGKVSMSVETPTAVAGIRGTKFGIEVKEKSGGSMASRPVYLADASETGWIRFAQNSPGDSGTVGSYTIVYSFDGTVTVTSTVSGESVTLSTGEFVYMFTTGAGEVAPTPEGLSKLFQDDTDTSAPDGDDGGDGDGGDDGNGDGDDGDTGGDQGGDVAQQQNTMAVDATVITDPKTNAPETKIGYFAGMLSYNPDGLNWEATFISTTLQDFDSADVRADEVGGEVHSTYVEMDGTNSPKIITAWSLYSSESWSGSENVIQPPGSSDSNEYMEWGYWTQPLAMNDGSTDHYFDNRGYYVWGDNTQSMPTNGSYTYSGNAYGTFWTDGGGAHMGPDGYVTGGTGTFSTGVNFTSGALSNFTLAVSGNSHEAHISDGSGSITSGSQFQLDSATYAIGGSTGTVTGSTYGSFYGPGAEAMGGVWQMDDSYSGYHVAGSFVSDTKVEETGPGPG